MTIIWAKLIDLESLMLYTKTQSQSFLASEEEDIWVFLPYMAIVAILFSGTGPFKQIVSTFWQKAPCIIGENCSSSFSLKITKFFLHAYSQGQGQITPRGQNFDCN